MRLRRDKALFIVLSIASYLPTLQPISWTPFVVPQLKQTVGHSCLRFFRLIICCTRSAAGLLCEHSNTHRSMALSLILTLLGWVSKVTVFHLLSTKKPRFREV